MKKILFISSAVFVVLFGALQIYINLRKPTPTDELRIRASELPPLSLTALDGNAFRIPQGKPIVLIYFNSTCDHCQRQLEAMRKERGLLDDVTVILMSAQPLEDLHAYFNGIDLGHFNVVHVPPEQVSEKFGVLALPQVFVFGANRQLLDLFAGETAPEKIKSLLR
jgi:peroxiredoxin